MGAIILQFPDIRRKPVHSHAGDEDPLYRLDRCLKQPRNEQERIVGERWQKVLARIESGPE